MATPTKTAAPSHGAPSPSAGLGELGRTTSPRAWLALVALSLVIVAFAVWGLFGTIPVQTTIPASVTNGVYPVQITAGTAGVVNSIITPSEARKLSQDSAGSLPAGTTILTIAPAGGGKAVSVTIPVKMGVSLDVIQGSPVTEQTVVAHGSPISAAGSDDGKAQVYAFLSADQVQSVRNAQSLSVTPTAPGQKDIVAPIEVTYVGAVPVSQEQIALLTNGNTIVAEQAYQGAGGSPYVVVFTYLNAADAEKITGDAAAEVTVTEATPHPLSLLFGS